MKMIAYPASDRPFRLQPAGSKRPWMDDAVNKNPYRCLPLSMANSFGWEILSEAHFTAEWDGNNAPSGVKIKHHDGYGTPSSHFGEGTLTWHAGWLFQMEYPYGLYVTGAPNTPVPNVIPLSGVVEAHWLRYSFTLNWRFTQPGSFEVKIGDPIALIFPIDLTVFDNTEAEIRSLHDPEFKEFHDDYWNWNVSRLKYMSEQRAGHHSADVWQKHYFRGVYPAEVKDGSLMGDPTASSKKCPFHTNAEGKQQSTHRTKPNVREFVDKRIGKFETPPIYWELTKKIQDQRNLESSQNAQSTNQQVAVNSKEIEMENKLKELELKLRIAETQLKLQSTQLPKANKSKTATKKKKISVEVK
jgi:hypothetical protein